MICLRQIVPAFKLRQIKIPRHLRWGNLSVLRFKKKGPLRKMMQPFSHREGYLFKSHIYEGLSLRTINTAGEYGIYSPRKS